MEPIKFTRTQIRHMFKCSPNFITELELRTGLVDDDIVQQLYTAELRAMFFERTNPIQTINVTAPPPSFLDWLFKRERKISKQIIVKDILLDPPTTDNIIRYIEN